MKAEFGRICSMSQKKVKKYVTKQLKETHDEVTVADGFVYAQGKFPVLLVAHMDTVHKHLPDKIIYEGDKISSPNGIGGDDRCGIYMILEIIKKYHCSVLFCEDEEIGMVGAEKFIKTKLAKSLVGQFNYIIEFDRRGSNDAVFYDCANNEFENFITKEFYKSDYGSFSDISTIAPFLGIAAVNLSCGYYNAHTKEEYVLWSEMEASMKQAMKIMARTTDEKFEYVEAEHNYYGYGYEYDSWFDGYDYDEYGDGWYLICFLNEKGEEEIFETGAVSKAEAIGRFCMDNQYNCVSDIVDIYFEELGLGE